MKHGFTFVDDRTDEEKDTHYWIVKGRDSFMSGWGGAASGYSVAAWARKYEDLDAVLQWVRSRSEMKYVRATLARTYRPPRTTAHFHIYVVRPGHSALDAKAVQS